MIKKLKLKFPFGLYFIVIISLFLYSFTQIDLSLTFSRIEILRNIVKSFQYIGYFNRPLSALLVLSIIIFMFGFYIYFLKKAQKKLIDKKSFWIVTIAVSTVLVFSYNAFSYDIFNYIFDAKIFTHYNLNPYFHKALDFPGDPMLSFMRWTHRVYPYGPFWLILSIPLSYLGSNFFLPTFFLFKLMIGASFLGSLYYISKIIRRISPGKEIFGLVFFGLNPLVLIESLVSSHLDIVMMFLALVAFYKLINKKYLWAFILLFLSIEVKFATAFLIPIFIYVYVLQKKEKPITYNLVLILMTLLMSISVIFSSIYSGNFQPWYLILPLSTAVFSARKYYILVPSIIMSFVALMTYLPYLYLGNWDKPVPQIMYNLLIVGVVVSIISVLFYYLFKHKRFASKSAI